MEIFNCKIANEGSDYYLSLEHSAEILNVPLTKDEPNEIKKVFNRIIINLKNGCFNFKIEEKADGDVYYHISKEYISQLNTELTDIYEEMIALNLTADNK